jgi:hypothetical protein
LRTVPIAGRKAIVLDRGRLGGIDEVGHWRRGGFPVMFGRGSHGVDESTQ